MDYIQVTLFAAPLVIEIHFCPAVLQFPYATFDVFDAPFHQHFTIGSSPLAASLRQEPNDQ
jgi:hypothetical protein